MHSIYDSIWSDQPDQVFHPMKELEDSLDLDAFTKNCNAESGCGGKCVQSWVI